MTDSLVEKLSPAAAADDLTDVERGLILEAVGEVCYSQDQYRLAAKKFTQAGKKLKVACHLTLNNIYHTLLNPLISSAVKHILMDGPHLMNVCRVKSAKDFTAFSSEDILKWHHWFCTWNSFLQSYLMFVSRNLRYLNTLDRSVYLLAQLHSSLVILHLCGTKWAFMCCYTDWSQSLSVLSLL